jgi:hypothetical protein
MIQPIEAILEVILVNQVAKVRDKEKKEKRKGLCLYFHSGETLVVWKTSALGTIISFEERILTYP